jgi:hypothetical protein
MDPFHQGTIIDKEALQKQTEKFKRFMNKSL